MTGCTGIADSFLSSLLRGGDRLYIPALIGGWVLTWLLMYKYHWMVMLNTFLLSVVFIEPAPCDILFVLLFIFGIAGKHIDLARLKGYKSAVLSFILFAIVNTLQLFNIAERWVGIRYYAITLYLVVFCLYISIYANRDNMKGLLAAYVVSSTISALLGILAHLGVFPTILMYDEYSIKGFFKDPNVLGPFLVPAVLIMIDDMGKRRLLSCPIWVYPAVIVINMLGIIATFSRGAWLNLLVCISLYFILNIRKIDFKKVNYKKLLVYAAFFAVAGFLFWNYGLSRDFKLFIFSRLGIQSYDADRFTVQNIGISLALDNLLGYGPGQFECTVMDQIGVKFSSHNLYIRLLVENGAGGFLIFTSGLICIFYRLILDFRLGRSYAVLTPAGLSAILSGIMVNSMVIDTLHWRHFWFFIGLSMANVILGAGKKIENKGAG